MGTGSVTIERTRFEVLSARFRPAAPVFRNMRLSWKRVCSSMARVMVAASVPMTVSLPAAAAPQSSPSLPATKLGFWVGDQAPTQPGKPALREEEAYYLPSDLSAFTPEVWRTLQSHRIALYLNVRYGRDFGPIRGGAHSETEALVKKANALGVPVVAWIVIPYEKGYWAYQGNAKEMFDAVKAWASWKKAAKLRFEAVALDQEFSWQDLQTYIPLAKSRDPQKLATWMRGNIDPDAQCTALRTYRDMISWAHGRGIRVDAAEAPMVVDDLVDGDLALQNGLQISGASRDYDRMYLMAYRSAVAESGIDAGTAYPAGYYTAMQRFFGAPGQVSLGIPGQKPYATLATLATDVRVLAGMGATDIPIYSLETMVQAFGASGIATLANAAEKPMTREEIEKLAAPAPASEAIASMTKRNNDSATELTSAVMKERGLTRGANSWPNTCNLTPAIPLAHAKKVIEYRR